MSVVAVKFTSSGKAYNYIDIESLTKKGDMVTVHSSYSNSYRTVKVVRVDNNNRNDYGLKRIKRNLTQEKREEEHDMSGITMNNNFEVRTQQIWANAVQANLVLGTTDEDAIASADTVANAFLNRFDKNGVKVTKTLINVFEEK